MFDELMINHCAPTLSGIKIANIFTYQYNVIEEVYKKIIYYNRLLNSRGIYITIIKDNNSKIIIYVYNRQRLENYLSNEDILNFLSEYGYTSNDMYANIRLLKNRMQNSDVFPQEIGIFLGYPLIDIYGFINNYGRNSLYTGYWKVYHNKNEAVKLFDIYNKCRLFFINTFLMGKNILEIMDDYEIHNQNLI